MIDQVPRPKSRQDLDGLGIHYAVSGWVANGVPTGKRRRLALFRGNGPGFTMVVALVMMVLLTTLALGLLTLSTVTLRSSSVESSMSLARSNARLALMLAVGDLQKYTGADQRVTAPARILDTDPNTPQIEGVTSPEWLGAWTTNTNGNITDPSLIARGTNTEVGLKDVRLGVRRPQLAYLVSGSPTSATAPRPADSVTMVSAGSQTGREVWVPKVRLKTSSGSVKGSYGFWVRDLSESVPLNLRNRNGSTTASSSNPANGGYSKLLSPSAQSASVISSFKSLEGATDENLRKSFTQGSAVLASVDVKSMQDSLKTKLFHSVGQPAYGLLTDSLRGGLRANLTPYLNGGGSLASDITGMTGISDSQAMISDTRLSKFSPKFGLLRSYWKMADKLSSDFVNPSMDVQMPRMRADAYGPERQSRIAMEVNPVVTEYSVYLDLVFNPSDNYFYLMVFPRVTLYNPYNVKLNARPYHVQITNRIYTRWDVQVADASGIFTTKSIDYDNYFSNPSGLGIGGRDKDLCFYLESTSMEPGEALVFSPKVTSGAGLLFRKSAELQFPTGGDMTKNVLSATVPPTDMTSYYKRIGAVQPSSNVKPTYRLKRYWDNGFHFGYDMSLGARLRTPTSGSTFQASMATVNSDWPVIQALDSDNWFRANNGRWRDNNQDYALYSRDTFISNGVPPNNRTQFGFRLKWFQETDSNLSRNPSCNWNAAPLANYDIRSSYSHRNPWDGLFQVTDHYNEFCYGQYAIDTQAPAWTDPDVLPAYSGGKQRISPFYRSTLYSGAHTFPLFDLPRKQLPPLGLGQLRHAHLSAFSFWPSFILGESYAPLTVTRKSTSWPTTEIEAAWTTGAQQYAGAPWWEKNGSTALAPSEFNCVYDVSYEVNHALWDSYFMTGLSGSESGWDGTKWNEDVAMPNPRMIPNPFDPSSQQKDWMLGYRRAAKSLVIEAPFNVNSADKDAWATLLKSFRGLDIPTRKSGSTISADQQAFARLLVPDEGGATGVSSTARANWTAFQRLTDAQIDLLAESLVKEVKRRAPFISLADFVNRRLVNGVDNPAAETDKSKSGLVGPIQAALDDTQVTINNFLSDYPMPQDLRATVYPLVTDGIATERRGDGSHLPAGKAAFSPGFVSQGDILAKIGHVLTARGDTFVIRAYGDAMSADGTQVMARAYCEATVQRIQNYVERTADQPEVTPNSLSSSINRFFGRHYEMIDFRWLLPSEI